MAVCDVQLTDHMFMDEDTAYLEYVNPFAEFFLSFYVGQHNTRQHEQAGKVGW